MIRRTFAHRFAAYVAVLLLVLRAGAPMLAADAARWRDVPLGEICTAYGFPAPGVEAAQVGPGGAGSRDESPGKGGAHDHEECALAALAALSSPPPAAAFDVPPPRFVESAATAIAASPHRDFTARWTALRKHGPPAEA
jgi:hypothetical protein